MEPHAKTPSADSGTGAADVSAPLQPLRSAGGAAFRPRISIVIPVYNGADFLGEAIESALNQTYENREVIVVNDGSADGGATERVARSFGDRIRYFSKPNGGVATALNRGIDEMSGEYFSWLSHDDRYLPEKLARQTAVLAQLPEPRHSIVYSDFATFSDDPAGAVPCILPEVAPDGFRHFITVASAVHGCTLLVPRQAFVEHGRFDPDLRTTQDYDLWFRMAATYTFVYEPRVLVLARIHPGQGTHAMSDLALRESDALRLNFLARLSEAEVRQEATTSLAEGYFRLALAFEANGFARARARAMDLCRGSFDRLTADELVELLTRQAQAARVQAQTVRVQAQEIQSLIAERDGFQEQARELRCRLDDTLASTSWQVTAPLRRLTAALGRRSR